MSKYDLIMVGSGHNSLVCACYLAKAGMKILVLERNKFPGGATSTMECTLPGFKHDNASMACFIFYGPVLGDLELESKYGLEYYFPEKIYGSAYMDGSSIAMYKDVNRTCQSIAKVSVQDAETFKRLYDQFLGIKDPLLSGLYRLPPKPSEFFSNLEKVPGGEELMRVAFLSPKQVLDELFVDERVKGWIFGLTSAFLTSPDAFGTGLSVFTAPLSVQAIGKDGKAKGGTAMFTQALIKCLEDNGGEIRMNAEVEKIIVKDGKVRGVHCVDKEAIEAKKGVVANIPPHLITKLAGEGNVGQDFTRKSKNYDFGHGMFNLHIALDGAVKFNASELDDACAVLFLDTLAYSIKMFRDCDDGVIPWNNLPVFMDNFDLTLNRETGRAPEGKAAALLAAIPVPATFADGSSWDYHEARLKEALIARMEDYAPNFRGLILDAHVQSPLSIEKMIPGMVGGDTMLGRNTMEQSYFRPFPGYTHYRTSIPNLYMTGGFTWPSGGIIAAPGYNAAGVIAEDLGMKRWW